MAEDMVEQMRRFSLIQDEEDIIVIDPSLRARAIKECFASLVGKLLTKRGFSKAALKDTMRKVWGSPLGLRIVDVGDKLFHFRFSNESDLQRVVNGGPWCFDNMLFLLRKWEVGMKVDNVDFHEIDFWVQLWGLPFECVSPEFGQAIKSRIGMVIDVSKGTDQGDRGQYIRVRIRIPLDRPLRRGGHVVLGEGDKVWVDYKYDRLPAFCHYCGMLDHVVAGVTKENAFGAWLAASQGFRRGYKWKGAEGDFQRRKLGWDVSSRKQSLVFSGGGGSGGGRTDDDFGDKHEKITGMIEGQDSRLREVDDSTLVTLNGMQFRMGDLIPDPPRILNGMVLNKDLVGHGMDEIRRDGADDGSKLVFKNGEAQGVHDGLSGVRPVIGNPLGLDKFPGPICQMGSEHIETRPLDCQVMKASQLVEVHVFKASDTIGSSTNGL
ncbi:hypothetical protein RHSIM_Rhsim03G0079400 [Rhododendron simsii]|uniref:DUF4283 domain-containing protein n=1 Tax=Rhododendron simsii TaxID=118357 RepID=A0A834LP20_RHOSS|nr:hypothetical protein RHSIM_Rhsim03G0080000 [Rhododendron simsii]KAF7149182.1 hypothetical protein RHSIM_Rhsim03G0079400 [Rhododendron simsii]